MHFNTKCFLIIVQNVYICSSLTYDYPMSFTNGPPKLSSTLYLNLLFCIIALLKILNYIPPIHLDFT